MRGDQRATVRTRISNDGPRGKVVEYWIDGRQVRFEVQGEVRHGEHRVLLEEDDNVIKDSGWDDRGYTVAPFLDVERRRRLREGIRELIRGELHALGISTGSSFSLEHYHRLVATDALHLEVVGRTRLGFHREQFPIDLNQVVDCVSEICGVPLAVESPRYTGRTFYVRIVRPGKQHDNNPPHRDVWLDRLRDGVNLYAPIAGSNRLSSLPLLPGSHKWPESDIERSTEGARIKGLNYTVPAVTDVRGRFVMTRPDPGPAEVLVFSPYLIHGGAVNFNADLTRVSLEMRLWRKQPAAVKHAA
jgi:hypothetical protein